MQRKPGLGKPDLGRRCRPGGRDHHNNSTVASISSAVPHLAIHPAAGSRIGILARTQEALAHFTGVRAGRTDDIERYHVRRERRGQRYRLCWAAGNQRRLQRLGRHPLLKYRDGVRRGQADAERESVRMASAAGCNRNMTGSRSRKPRVFPSGRGTSVRRLRFPYSHSRGRRHWLRNVRSAVPGAEARQVGDGVEVIQGVPG